MQSNRARKILNLLNESVNNTIDTINNNTGIDDMIPTRDEEGSPLPPDANFTEEELSILDDVDLNDSKDVLQNIPSNASILFPDDIPCSSPWLSTGDHNRTQNGDRSPSVIENTPGNSPIQSNFIIENYCDITPVPSPYNSFAPSPVNFELFDSPAVTTPASDINDITYSPCNNDKRRRKRISIAKKDKGRLRERFQKKWKDQERKYNVNRGLEYVSRNGRVHGKRNMKTSCPITCRKKCSEKLTEDIRQRIFDRFWSIGDHSRQWDFLARYAIRAEKKRITVDKENSKRLHTISYYLPSSQGDNIETTKIPVCKTTFLRTLSISFNFVYTALEKSDKGNGFIETDQRGRHINHPKIINEDIVRSVIDHVEAFSPVESHYTRQKSSKKYLEASLSFPKMFKLYNEWFDSNKYSSKATTVRQYRDIINKNINIGFHKPKKDVCEQCHIYENNKEVTQTDKEKHEEHLKEKDKARKMKTQNKDSALQNHEILTAAFDLQKCLNVPHGNFIADTVGNGIKDYRFWSDNCGGQNRNRIVFLMYMLASSKFFIDIGHRFLVVGHTQNEGDSMHALIERQTKDKMLYTPDQWYTAFRFAKSDEKPYKVTEVSQDLIKDFKSKLKLINNWTTTNDGSKMPWIKVMEVLVKAEYPFRLFYKTSYQDDAYKWIDCVKKPKATRNRRELNIDIDNIPLAYQTPIPIDQNKHKDLMDLCKALVIPKEYHLFF
ncbi:hypothetical protein HF086_012856 [Spodoptera exigua]|uniref:DUF7869 domain-containing protein n=1 Tax=Spodoptera exigua TaxID=7107 RepID=A0A922MV31_SPOEX|nr:hypothetical protein HF086_012856 [Spodoptera exigua]